MADGDMVGADWGSDLTKRSSTVEVGVVGRRRHRRPQRGATAQCIAQNQAPAMLFFATPFEAIALCLLMACLYVGSLYLIPASIRARSWEDATKIQARIATTVLTCVCCMCILWINGTSFPGTPSFWSWIGLRSDAVINAIVIPPFLTAMLFIGPIVVTFLELNSFRCNARKGTPRSSPLPWKTVLERSSFVQNAMEDPWPTARIIIFGPLAEEVVFRSCMAPLLLCAGVGQGTLIARLPLVFGVAHLHNAVEMVRAGHSPQTAMLQAAVQLCYTSLFGAYATFMLLRTSNVVPVFLVHVLCNMLGVPDLSFLTAHHALYEHRRALMGCYVMGVVAFSYALMPLSEPSLYGPTTTASFWEFDVARFSRA